MPEFKHNFTGGKMNKDVDERLVPKSEYRDAMNIQVSTSEGSDVGTVQNTLGNAQGCNTTVMDGLLPSNSSFTVGSIADEKNDSLYWLVSGQPYDSLNPSEYVTSWTDFTTLTDIIIRKRPSTHEGQPDVCEPVFVDQHAFTIANTEYSPISTLSGLVPSLASQVGLDWTVTGVSTDGTISNTVEVTSVATSPLIPANNNFIVTIGGGFTVPLIVSPQGVPSQIQGNNILYISFPNPGITTADMVGVTLDLFAPGHPDYQSNEIQSASFVTLEYVQTGPSVFVDYLELTMLNGVVPFVDSNSFNTRFTSAGAYGGVYQGSIIWGTYIVTVGNNTFTIPIPNNVINVDIADLDVGLDLNLGDPVVFQGVYGCVGTIGFVDLFSNDFTVVDCATGAPIAVPAALSFTLPLETVIHLDGTLNLNSTHSALILAKPRILNFNHEEYITGINIIDDMLFWTDGATEPKKINISRSVEGTDESGLFHTRLINSDLNINYASNVLIKEEHITVIRSAPLKPPHLEINTTTREGITSGSEVVTTNATAPFLSSTIGNEVKLYFTEVSENPFGFKKGDVMLLSDDMDNLPDKWEIRAIVIKITSSGGVSEILVKIESMIDVVDTTKITWYGSLEQEKSLFQRKLPRFAYRYKYEDGEYSSFSPFTQVAFVPGEFNYQPIKAYNKGMVNSIKSLKVQNFVSLDMPLDVVSVDLLYKNETSPLVYLLKSISPNDLILTEGETANYWNTLTNFSAGGVNKGSYEVSSENITSTLPSSQSLRAWDNVPRRALAQEMTGNRIVYGNYTQGYESIQPNIEATLDARVIDSSANTGRKSVKSLRDYDIGVVWGDRYGRETPVKTAGSRGSITVPKSKSATSNYINVNLKNSPDWAEYYRVYIKETSNEYYNLAVDRVYDAADGNIWISFPSVDRNKVDEDTYIILKKGIESSELVDEEARYKIVAIENEAPEFIRTTFERLVRTNTDDSRSSYSCNLFAGSNPCDGTSTPPYPGGGRNAPDVGMKGFSLSAGGWLRDYSTIYDPLNAIYLGMQLVSPKVLFDEVSSNNSGSTTDEFYVSFSKEVTDSDGITIISPVSKKYHVIQVDDTNVTFTGTAGSGFFYINLDEPIISEDEWITENIGEIDNIHIHFWKKTIINKPEFDGRFFVKILGGDNVTNRLTNPTVLINNLSIAATMSLYKIEDNKADDFDDGGDYLYNDGSAYPNALSASDTNSKNDWESLLKFGGSSLQGGWFIDRATFASRQNGPATLPANGTLSYSDVKTTHAVDNQANQKSCDTTSSVNFTYTASCTGIVGDFTQTFDRDLNVGRGYSTARLGMKGVWDDGSYNYVDISYSQIGPSGNPNNYTTNYNLFWNVGSASNSYSDDEAKVVASLKLNSRFRLKGSEVVYKIKGVTKFRLFNYQGKLTISNPSHISFDYIPSWTGWSDTSRQLYSSLCGLFVNTQYPFYNNRMKDKTNRRLTYRIKYEVDELFTPDTSTVQTLDEDSSYGDITRTDAVSLQFLTDYTAEGENPISSDPAIFETEPKEEVDIDIYYEASSSLATLPITNKNKHLFIPIGSTIIPPPNTGFSQGVFVTSWGNIDPNSPQYIINLSSALSSDDFDTLIQTEVNYIEKDNGEIASFAVIDAGALDPSTGLAIALLIIPNEETGLNWFNCWSFNNGVESNRIGDTYNKPYITNGVTASSSTGELKEQETRKNGLIYSGIYNSTSGVNNLNQFIAAEKITKDINPIYGSIQKLKAGWGQGGDLIALCEDRILKILANKDALFNADGNPQLTSTNNVLGQAIPYSGEYGISKNPESFASEAYRIYFTDKVRGTVMRLSMDGLTSVSSHGMKDWFRDNLKLSNKLIGSYDDKKEEYNITLKGDPSILSRETPGYPTTVSFREDVKGWVSFKSFMPENAISCANEYYTFRDGRIWEHHKENIDANNFYSLPNDSSFTVIINEAPGSIKSFKSINYEGSQSRIKQFITDTTTGLTDGEYYNLTPKKGWYVDSIFTDKESGTIDEFIEKEGKWFNYIKGIDVKVDGGTVAINPDGSSTFDQASFAVQGLGILNQAHEIVSVYGCTDDSMFNYAEDANVNAVSSSDPTDPCIAFTFGCSSEPTANNYDASANSDDGSCIWVGCYEPECDVINSFLSHPNYIHASNYSVQNPTSDPFQDDGSCIDAIYGCADPTALNYNPLANVSHTQQVDCVSIFPCTYPSTPL